MDAGLMCERIAAHNRFVWLGSETDDRTQGLAGAVKMLILNARGERITIIPGLHHHDDLFERAVAGALPDTVDGAFDLTRPRLHGGQRIRYREAEVIMAVHTD